MTRLARCAIAALLASACAHPGRSPAPTAPVTTAEHFLSVDGTAGRLRVSDGGAGEPAVVLLHGLGADLEVWRPQLDHLRTTRRAIAYDQRGHGGSEKARDGVYTLEALAADVEAVRRDLGLGRVIDPPAFAALRRGLFEFRDARARYTGYRGPAVAVEAADNPYAAILAGQVLHLPRTEVAGVSHWLQLDDPDAVNRALDAFLAGFPVAR